MKYPARLLRYITIACLCAAGAAMGCAANLPQDKTAAALHRDLQRVVSMKNVIGWSIDRTEYEEMLPSALQSVCRVPPEKRAALLAWQDQRIAELDGPVEAAYEKRGRKLKRVKHLLEMTRIRTLLARSIENADADCPFWIEPSESFRGRQTIDDHWMITSGGGGKFIVFNSGGDTKLNAGGAGRLLFGRAFGTGLAILAGVEIGASAGLDEVDDEGNRQVFFAIDAVAPLVMRFRSLNTYLEIEAGPMYRYAENVPDLTPGVHAGIAIGGRTSRQRWIFPGLVFGVAVERTLPDEGEDPITMFKLGFRAEFDLPW
jgi:hypothetical protein